MNLKGILSSLITVVLPLPLWAQMFSADEVRLHSQRIDIITSTASECLTSTYQDHVSFYNKWKVSKYYGDRKPDYRTEEGRKEALRKYGAPASLSSELEPISCIGLTMKCLSKGFEKAGLESTWNKIYRQLAIDGKFYGTDLQKMLRELGWQTLYWNPNPSMNAKWDEEDQRINPLQPGKVWNPVWGGHAYRYSQVLKKNEYYGVPVDDKVSLVDFKDQAPLYLKQFPFFVGTAHAGYHVFPGFFGQVIEAHSMRNLNAFDNLEVSMFNPLGTGGGPRWTRSERYRSGILVVPPSKR